MKSVKPKKQRKEIYTAPLHRKYKLASSNLSKELRKKYSKRSLVARKGDEVKVMRGKSSGKTGKVSKVDVRKSRIFVDGVVRKKSSGEETMIPISPSNLMITDIVMEDKKRIKIMERKKV